MNQAMLLQEFRKSYDRLEAVRASATGPDGEREVAHAELNFRAAAESLARLLPAAGDIT